MPSGFAVKCVLLGIYPSGALSSETWCGRVPSQSMQAFEWMFQDASHALLNARHLGLTLICPECADAMKSAIERGRG